MSIHDYKWHDIGDTPYACPGDVKAMEPTLTLEDQWLTGDFRTTGYMIGRDRSDNHPSKEQPRSSLLDSVSRDNVGTLRSRHWQDYIFKYDDQFRPKLVTRAEWEASDAKSTRALIPPIENVLFTLTTETKKCWSETTCKKLVKELQEKHMNEGLSDIKYNFLVGSDGVIYEGRGWNVESSKSLESPEYPRLDEQKEELVGNRLDIAYIGEFRTDMGHVFLPTESQIIAALQFVNIAIREKLINRYYRYHEIPFERAKKDEYEFESVHFKHYTYKDLKSHML